MAKILVAECNTTLSETFSTCLTHCGHVVEIAHSTLTLFDLVNSFQPQLIIVDVMYCFDDGRNVCKEIKKQQSGIPVLLCATLPRLLEGFDQCGADDILDMPFDLHNLRSKINDLATAVTG